MSSSFESYPGGPYVSKDLAKGDPLLSVYHDAAERHAKNLMVLAEDKHLYGGRDVAHREQAQLAAYSAKIAGRYELIKSFENIAAQELAQGSAEQKAALRDLLLNEHDWRRLREALPEDPSVDEGWRIAQSAVTEYRSQTPDAG